MRTTQLLMKMFSPTQTKSECDVGARYGCATHASSLSPSGNGRCVAQSMSPSLVCIMLLWWLIAAGTLGYIEFERLWTQMTTWRAYFDAADSDRSGKLSIAEVTASVRHFGFALPDPLVVQMVAAYDEVRV